MAAHPIAIPFEPQNDSQGNRACGAACLAMVYRSFGKEVQQSEIWPHVFRRVASGGVASVTHLMVHDAQNRGLAAVGVQSRHPLQALQICRDSGIRAVLNTRLQPGSPIGHYIVLVDIDDTHVVVHDPYFGAGRRMTHAELLAMWELPSRDSEIIGHVLIAIAERPTAPRRHCTSCRTELPLSVHCPRCHETVALAPQALIGCMRDSCPERMWDHVCCPACDFMWSFGPRRAPPPEDPDPCKLEAAAAAIDKFAAFLRSRPYTASTPDLMAQLSYILDSKERLRTAQTEAQTHTRALQERLDATTKAAQESQAAHRRAMATANEPLPSLDGQALADALLLYLSDVVA